MTAEIAQKNLAESLMYLAKITNRGDILEESIKEYWTLIDKLKTDAMLREKAAIMDSLGRCLLALGKATCNNALLKEVVDIFTSILAIDNNENNSVDRNAVTLNLNDARAALHLQKSVEMT
jgi:tetratricopeptide (TPR) repeat protein